MSLMNDLKEIQGEMTSLLDKLDKLQQKVDSLETQNLKLLDRLNEKNIMSEGGENLMSLYREGYHICPTFFAKKREPGDSCLFCRGFIKKQWGIELDEERESL